MNNEQLTMDNARSEEQAAPAVYAPPGYKQTEVGVIPVEWETKRFGEVLTVRHGRSQAQVESDAGEYPILGTSGIIGRTHTYLWDQPSVLIGRKGTIDRPQYMDSPFWTIDTLFYTTINDTEDAKFLFYRFCIIDWQSLNEASGVPSLSSSNIERQTFERPPLPEQRAIAAALADVDGLITALDRLIAKKRAIKQATMQQLLTGKTRLPGFGGAAMGYKQTEVGVIPEDWEVRTIKDVADVKTGPFGSSLHERDYVEDGTPIITVEHLSDYGILHENLPQVSDSDRLRLRSYELRQNDIVFSRVGSVDRNSLVRLAEDGWLFSGRLLRVRVSTQHVHPPYLSYHFHSEPFKQRVRTVAVGQTMASLNTQLLKTISIVLPLFDEQTAIAAVLSDMDAEIAALEQRRAKTQAIKQGMMQQLLTGRIRLTTEEVNV